MSGVIRVIGLSLGYTNENYAAVPSDFYQIPAKFGCKLPTIDLELVSENYYIMPRNHSWFKNSEKVGS